MRVSIERELAATRTAMEKGADLAANAAEIAATAADRASAANDPFAGIAAQRANQAADEAAEFSEMAAQWLRREPGPRVANLPIGPVDSNVRAGVDHQHPQVQIAGCDATGSGSRTQAAGTFHVRRKRNRVGQRGSR